MIGLLDPRFWLAAILAVTLSFFAGDWTGHRNASKKYELVAAKADAAALAQTAAITKKLNTDIDAITAQSNKEKQDAKAQNDKLRAALRAGTQRLSVATSSCVAAGTSTTGVTETRAELLPAAAADIFDIGADADNAVRDLNACIDAYNKVRERSRESQ